MVLKGKTKELTSNLEEEMKDASTKQLYERALELRNQLAAIEWLSEKQRMQRRKRYDEDILNYKFHFDCVYLILFNVSLNS